MLKSFRGSIIVSLLGLAVAFWIGFHAGGMAEGLSTLFVCAVLAVLEISLSFDNAVVNATVLTQMTELWRRRFLTWGILLAVFGMRLILPLGIVALLAEINPVQALTMAIHAPKEYSSLMLSIHDQVASFGGTFLFMVGIAYFLNSDKDQHWLKWVERPLAKLGRIHYVEVVLALVIVIVITLFVDSPKQLGFLISGVAGVITFLIVDGLGALLGESPKSGAIDVHKASLGMFLYLEVLDASFSFDGVIGAFALTQSLFLISIGLGIGAMFVRSITILLVEKGTLSQFRYLENGAFWAILSLSFLMYLGVFRHIPEFITGLCGAVFIGAALLASMRWTKKHDPNHLLDYETHVSDS